MKGMTITIEAQVMMTSCTLKTTWPGGELKFASVAVGEQCVMILGTMRMLQWSANSWDFLLMVIVIQPH